MFLISLSSFEKVFLLIIFTKREAKQRDNSLQFSHWTQIQTLRFSSLTVPVNAGTLAERCAHTFKGGFSREETQERNMGIHHVLITPTKVGDLCLSVPFFCVISVYTLNKLCHSFSCMCLVQELWITSLPTFSASSWLSKGCTLSHEKNNRIKMKLTYCLLSCSGLGGMLRSESMMHAAS